MEVTYVHTPEGKLINKDPTAAFCVIGTRVKIIKANPGIGIEQGVVGLEGVVDKECARLNTRSYNEKRDQFYAMYRTRDYGDTVMYYGNKDILEIVSVG